MDHNGIPIGQSFCGMDIKIHANSLGQRSFQNLRQTYAKLWSV
ncbi:Uncharacterised protein [Comamonas testosteroni]|uniref:Uncharacterized protein n=1 Tax=Comamonas testosteroni TaxID=285 RepID=A0A8B4S767_COMTE|nr:hypothetical protein CTATCC11996_10433 [Comamonas testosteroni ATCC 11996]RDI10811.1 hypothetical protein DFO48_105325 [Comamonas sp. AG1104]SUY78293.1 Uncharacterised protein [Comamonas testosteroni]